MFNQARKAKRNFFHIKALIFAKNILHHLIFNLVARYMKNMSAVHTNNEIISS